MPPNSPSPRTLPTERLGRVLEESLEIQGALRRAKLTIAQVLSSWGLRPEAEAEAELRDLLASLSLLEAPRTLEAAAYLRAQAKKLNEGRNYQRRRRNKSPRNYSPELPEAEELPKATELFESQVPAFSPFSLEDIEEKLRSLPEEG